ncbi:hypothetical protein BKA70DRAFT_1267051 [Coprinopsis sp. MPI-PUGE-AT-0042]|nr:hypothetical protein BKA70DRAFT_1267051 [Coprinopsis sp. MPI-PUGE-AT-0042]
MHPTIPLIILSLVRVGITTVMRPNPRTDAAVTSIATVPYNVWEAHMNNKEILGRCGEPCCALCFRVRTRTGAYRACLLDFKAVIVSIHFGYEE